MQLKWEVVESIPESYGGISKGVSASFAGVIAGKLIVAGGCNFPDKPVTEGGKKVFYKEILMNDAGKWQKIGEMPEALAYGVTVKAGDALYFIGGQNEKSFNSFLKITVNASGIANVEKLADLPVMFDNGAGTLSGDKVIIVGGNQNGKPSSDVWAYDLAGVGEWVQYASLPIANGLVQGVAVSMKSEKEKETKSTQTATENQREVFVFGGFSPVAADAPALVNQNVLRYAGAENPSWQFGKVPYPSDDAKSSFSGGVGAAINHNQILLMGGVNKEIFEYALNRIHYMAGKTLDDKDAYTEKLREEGAAYMHHPTEWYKFNPSVWIYNVNTSEWKNLGVYPQAALAGASVAVDNDAVYLVNGELKPGIRTPKIWKITW